MNGFLRPMGKLPIPLLILLVMGLLPVQAQTILDVSTYYGGSTADGEADIAIAEAADGSIYVATNTSGTDIAVAPDAYQAASAGGYDLVIARFASDMRTLVSGTFLGGSGNEAYTPGVDMAIAADGTIYVLSTSKSVDWPVTPNAFQSSLSGGMDLVLARLGPGLDQLLAATYLGGSSDDDFGKLVCLPGGDVVVVCSSTSGDFPTTAGAYHETPFGGRDLVLTRLDANLENLVGGTYLGGAWDDWPEALDVDAAGNPYVSGWTRYAFFPTTTGAYQTTDIGDFSAFICRVSGDLSALEASTFIGGTKWEFSYGLAVDPSGDVYACGHTASGNFPVTSGCYQPALSGTAQGVDDDMWIARFDHDLTTLKAATYLGGTGWENGLELVPLSSGVVVGGTSSSPDWPVTGGAIDTVQSGGGRYYTTEVALAVLDGDLATLSAGSYLGGIGTDNLGSLWPTGDGGVWLVSGTSSSDLPVNPEAFDPTRNGGNSTWAGDLFLARLGADLGSAQASHTALPPLENGLKVVGARPNPFNPRTDISFTLDRDMVLRVTIHDTAGRRVAVVAERAFPAGYHSVVWTGQDSAGRPLSSGIYLARIAGGRQQQTVKLMLVK